MLRFKKPSPQKKPAIRVRKISLSLPPEVVADLDSISETMGLSRSAFLSALLAQSLPPLKTTIDTMSALQSDAVDGDEPTQQRYNSESKEAIDAFFRAVSGGVQDDLFKGK